MLSAATAVRSRVAGAARAAVRAATPAASRTFIIRTFEDVQAAGGVKDAATGTWQSQRYLTRKDGMGFSMHRTIVKEGTSTLIWYQNHVEAVFITHGEGEIELVGPDQKEGEGIVHKLAPGTMYGLDGQERHYLRATKGDIVVVCAFNPPVAGTEDHNADGVYPAVDDEGAAHFTMDGATVSEKLIKPPASLVNGTRSVPVGFEGK